jgi:hypothetical protein
MILGTASINSFPDISYALSSYQVGRLAFPVSPSSYIYSNFKHVSGIPAENGEPGVPLTKLKILDVLIDQLSQIKRSASQIPTKVQRDSISSDPRKIDALIEQYEKEIRTAIAESAAMPYKPHPSAPAGTLLNLVA